MGREMMSVKENPRFNFKAARMWLILAIREAAPDEPIVMRYPIRVYQSDQSLQNVFSTLFFTRWLKRDVLRSKKRLTVVTSYQLLDGNEKWFELTEIIDPEYVKVKKARIAFAKILEDFLLKDQLFLVTFKNKKVMVGFSQKFTSTQVLKKNLIELQKYLHYLNAKGIKEISPKNKFSFIDYITIQGSIFGIQVRVPNAQSVGIPIKDRLDSKFRRNYAKDCDLLLYYDKLTVFDRAVPYENIKNYIVSKKENLFKKIWIFSLKDDSIVFQYPLNGD